MLDWDEAGGKCVNSRTNFVFVHTAQSQHNFINIQGSCGDFTGTSAEQEGRKRLLLPSDGSYSERSHVSIKTTKLLWQGRFIQINLISSHGCFTEYV